MRHSRKHVQDPSLVALQNALTAPPSADELVGEAETLSAYRAVSWRATRSFRRPAVLATKLGLATAAGVIGLSGVATAAYTGTLPDTLQDVAHKTIKAPKAHKDHPPTQAVGPDATGSAAYGLCQAFAKDKEHEDQADEHKATPTHEPQGHGKGLQNKQNKQDKSPGANEDRGQSKQKSVAYRNLVRAAGGEDKVEAYCAAVPKPSDGADNDADSDGAQEHGKPTSVPAHPTGKPDDGDHGKPSDLPAPAQSHPTGPPSPHPTGSPEELPAP